MMKKFGFTLAEVLITLGIIGVVAALTAPALVQNAGTAKIGPTLSKVVSTLENANEQLLHDEDATDLSKIAETPEEYCELLSKYISGSSYETEALTDDSFEPQIGNYNYPDTHTSIEENTYGFYFADNIFLAFRINKDFYQPKGSFKGSYIRIYADINGPLTKPNIAGKDIFGFWIDKSGQVVPFGSTTEAWLRGDDSLKYTSHSEEENSCNEDIVSDGWGCAGSIFENNFKVIYQ